jgi:hypothetical protein
MPDAATTSPSGAELMRVARLFEARGNIIAAICTYHEVICAGVEPAAAAARLRVAALAGASRTDLPS